MLTWNHRDSTPLSAAPRACGTVDRGWNIVKKKQHKNYQDEDKKSTINKKLILTMMVISYKILFDLI